MQEEEKQQFIIGKLKMGAEEGYFYEIYSFVGFVLVSRDLKKPNFLKVRFRFRFHSKPRFSVSVSVFQTNGIYTFTLFYKRFFLLYFYKNCVIISFHFCVLLVC